MDSSYYFKRYEGMIIIVSFDLTWYNEHVILVGHW